MIHHAIVRKIEQDDIVTFEIDAIELTCFAGMGTDGIEIGATYPIELSFFFIDDEDIELQNGSDRKATRMNDYFKYELKGESLPNGVFDFGILVADDVFDDCPYLFGEYITIHVDRIDVRFLW